MNMINQKYAKPGELFQLNVSGVTAGFLLDKELLCSVPNTALEAKFSGRYPIEKINGEVYLNRNPKIFNMLIDYLRMGLKMPNVTDPYDL